MKNIYEKGRCLLGVVILLLSGFGQASCKMATDYAATPPAPYPATVWSIAYGNTITVSRDAAVGTVLLDSGWRQNGAVAYVQCTQVNSDGVFVAYSGFLGAPVTGLVSPFNNYVYQTNLPGIGLMINYWNSTSSTPSGDMGWKAQTMPASWAVANAQSYSLASWFRVRLVKTGPIAAGTLQLAGIKAQVWYGGLAPNTAASVNAVTLVLSHNVTVNAQTCSLNMPNITKALPTVALSHLLAVGDTVGDQAFQIGMSCGSGIKVSYQLDATSYAGMASSSGVMAPDGSSTARGVGIQLLSGTVGSATPVSFGSVSLLKTLTAANDVLNIPLVARYYRVSSVVTPGSLTSVATLTMYYQ